MKTRSPMVLSLSVLWALTATPASSAAVVKPQDAAPPDAPIRVGGAIKAPNKVVNVPPVYPPIALAARVQGIVILEATISPEGRVTEARVLRGIPLLELRDNSPALNKSVDSLVASDTAWFPKNMKEGTFRFLRVMETGEAPVLLFGFSGHEGAIDYLLVRTRIAYDSYVAIGYFTSARGEWRSDTLTRAFRRMAMSQGRAVRLPNGDDWARSRGALDQIDRDISEGRFKAAFDTITNVPASLKSDRLIAMQRLQIAENLGPTELKLAAGDFFRMFPDDLAILSLLSPSLGWGDYDLALAVAEDLRRVVGADAALHDLRARILTARGDLKGGKEAARAALLEEPTLRAAYDTLLDISQAESDFEETGRLLSHIEKTYGQAPTALETSPRFSHFVKSEAYRRWRQSRSPASS